jgi:hypothetical protein
VLLVYNVYLQALAAMFERHKAEAGERLGRKLVLIDGDGMPHRFPPVISVDTPISPLMSPSLSPHLLPAMQPISSLFSDDAKEQGEAIMSEKRRRRSGSGIGSGSSGGVNDGTWQDVLGEDEYEAIWADVGSDPDDFD